MYVCIMLEIQIRDMHHFLQKIYLLTMLKFGVSTLYREGGGEEGEEAVEKYIIIISGKIELSFNSYIYIQALLSSVWAACRSAPYSGVL